jgi:hypothetical protein
VAAVVHRAVETPRGQSPFSTVLSIVTFHCKSTRALTFEKVCSGDAKRPKPGRVSSDLLALEMKEDEHLRTRERGSHLQGLGFRV